LKQLLGHDCGEGVHGLRPGQREREDAVGDVVAVGRAIALELTDSTSSVSVALARQMMWRGLTYPTPYRSHVADSRGIHVTGRSGDAVEGITSFLEKRPPAFPGRVSADLPDIFSDPQPSWAADLPL
jgi:hypothetical protein